MHLGGGCLYAAALGCYVLFVRRRAPQLVFAEGRNNNKKRAKRKRIESFLEA
jgi:hypothetical protein